MTEGGGVGAAWRAGGGGAGRPLGVVGWRAERAEGDLFRSIALGSFLREGLGDLDSNQD